MKTSNMKAAVLYSSKNIKLEDKAVPALESGMVLLLIKRVGICGSDLHYFEKGYCGSFVPSAPFVLGHELTGIVAGTAPDVTFPTIGARVTVNPARPCRQCPLCTSGRINLCLNTIMLGSGSTIPPTNGAMAEYVAVRADQCHILPDTLSDAEGAMIEPLAVALQAVKQARNVLGKTALVLGGGTIGLLTAVTAKAFDAKKVLVSDLVPERRIAATDFNVDGTLDPTDPSLKKEVLDVTEVGFDVIFEASGSSAALRQAFDLVAPGGKIIQIGTLASGDVAIPANYLMTKEIELIGSFRYGDIFDEAIALAASRRVNLSSFVTGTLPLTQITEAMNLASNKINSLKVQLSI